MTRHLVITILLLAATGCATVKTQQMYDGPPRSEEDIARLLVPEVIEVLSVDGMDIDVRGFKLIGHRHEFELLPGRHHLAARYSVVVDLDSEDHELFYSRPVTLAFDAEAGGVYRVAHRTGRARVVGGERTMDVDMWVEDTTAERPEPVSRLVERSTLPAEKKRATSPVQPMGEPSAVAPSSRPSDRTGDVPDVRALDLLKVWWEQASEEERRLFTDWIKTDN